MRNVALLFGFTAALMPSCSAQAQPLSAGAVDCGGDAFSSAEVIEHRPPRRGPITAGPDTLCADLAPQQPPTRVDIEAFPILTPDNGAGRGYAPYDGRLRRGGPPRP